MKRHMQRIFTLAAMMACLSTAVAQDDLAARELANGDRLARDGKAAQAQEAWRRVVERYPDSTQAPQAMDRLGNAAYPVEQFTGRGGEPGADPDGALGIYRLLAGDYRESPLAAHALFKMGLIYSDPAASAYDLDEAYARFSALVTIYPDSSYRAPGLLGMADILGRQGQCGRGLGLLADLDAGYPEGEWADDGLMLQAQCLLSGGNRQAAIRLYQEVRDRFPDGPLAGEARDRNTHLVRLLLAEKGEIYRTTTLVRIELPGAIEIRTVDGLTSGPGNRMVLVDGRSGLAHVMDAQGRAISQIAAQRPTAAWLGNRGAVLYADGSLQRGGQRTPLRDQKGDPIEGVAGLLAQDLQSRFLLWNEKSGDIVRFHRNLSFDRVMVSGRATRIDAAAMGPDGELATLDGRNLTVSFWNAEGRSRSVQLQGGVQRRPEQMAMDFLGNIFLMDPAARVIEMWDANGTLQTRLTSGKSDDDPFPRPEAMTVNGRGEILVYDQRRNGIVVFR